MTLNNNHIINYGEPFGSSFRRRRRRFAALSYNDRSPEVSAMRAHLRASAYPDNERAARSTDVLDRHDPAAVKRTGLSFNLLREYDNQVRDNFLKEAAVLAVVTAIGLVWPIAHILNSLVR